VKVPAGKIAHPPASGRRSGRPQNSGSIAAPQRALGFVRTLGNAGVTRRQLIFTPIHRDQEALAEGAKRPMPPVGASRQRTLKTNEAPVPRRI